jgi:hypothetical protein
MTPLTKTFLAFLSVAALVTGTIALRSRSSSEAVAAPAQLTPAQLAEINPPQKSAPAQPAATAASRPADVDIPPPPSEDEPDLEDGNGS